MKKTISMLALAAAALLPSVARADSFSLSFGWAQPVKHSRGYYNDRYCDPPRPAYRVAVRGYGSPAPDCYDELRRAELALNSASRELAHARQKADRLERIACAAEDHARRSARRANYDPYYERHADQDACEAREARTQADCAARELRDAENAYDQARCRLDRARDLVRAY